MTTITMRKACPSCGDNEPEWKDSEITCKCGACSISIGDIDDIEQICQRWDDRASSMDANGDTYRISDNEEVRKAIKRCIGRIEVIGMAQNRDKNIEEGVQIMAEYRFESNPESLTCQNLYQGYAPNGRKECVLCGIECKGDTDCTKCQFPLVFEESDRIARKLFFIEKEAKRNDNTQ